MGLGDDGGGGPRGGRPRPHARGRARSAPRRHRRRDLPPGLRRGGEHHALVLPPPPLRPAAPAALRPPLAAGVEGLPGLQPGHGRRRGGPGGRGRCRLRAGLPLLAAGADAGRGAPGPAHGALPAHALRRARHARRCCPTTCGRSCSTAWRATRPAASTATSGRTRSWPVTPRPDGMGRGRGRAVAVRRRRSWRRSAPTPACSRRRRRRPTVWRPRLRCATRRAGGASSPGPTAWSLRRTSCGGCSPSRNC